MCESGFLPAITTGLEAGRGGEPPPFSVAATRDNDNLGRCTETCQTDSGTMVYLRVMASSCSEPVRCFAQSCRVHYNLESGGHLFVPSPVGFNILQAETVHFFQMSSLLPLFGLLGWIGEEG